MSYTDEEKRVWGIKVKRYDAAVKGLNVELDFFWKRSAFFWGFIALFFVALVNIHRDQPQLALVMGSVGFVFSFGWTLLNRGNKFWQERWEAKVFDTELDVTGKVYAREEQPQFGKGKWLRGIRFSPSRLIIAISDYVAVVWLMVMIVEVCRILRPEAYPRVLEMASIGFAVASVIYVMIVYVHTKSYRQYKAKNER